MDRKDEVAQVLFWDAVDKYLDVPPAIGKKLRTFITFDQDVAKDSFAELLSMSHAFTDIPVRATIRGSVAVLLRVIEYAAKVHERGHRLHVGCLCVTRKNETVKVKNQSCQVTRENIFVPVKMV